MDSQKDADAGFRLTGRAADDDPRGADLDNTELGGVDVVAIEAAPRPRSSASVQTVVRGAHIERILARENRSTDPGAEDR